jgi:DNA-binding HxlR family transcriptional regulator
MRPYAQYCPIVRAVELLGDRWTLLIVRDMLIGATRFNELARGLPGLSRALLTHAGAELRPLVFGLADWGARYAFGDPRPEELDPDVLMWWMHGRVDTSSLSRRAVIQVEIADRRRKYWLVLEPGDASVCYTDPGFDIDAVRAGDIDLTGARWVVRGLPGWLQLSPVAPMVRAARLS